VLRKLTVVLTYVAVWGLCPGFVAAQAQGLVSPPASAVTPRLAAANVSDGSSLKPRQTLYRELCKKAAPAPRLHLAWRQQTAALSDTSLPKRDAGRSST
jgi:hypothetical protein